jgi:hypothetical protein
VPPISGSFHVSGIQTLMKENETLTNLKAVVIPLAGSPVFAKFIKPYKVLQALELRTNLTDEDIFVSEKEASMIIAQQYEELAKQAAAAAQAADIQNAHAAADLMTKIESIQPAGKQTYAGEA